MKQLRNLAAYLLLCLKKLALSLFRLLLLFPGKVLVIKLRNINTRDVDLGGCSNDVGLVHTADRYSIDLERPCKDNMNVKNKVTLSRATYQKQLHA